jgi:YidC/Oxa1 family membrane protein insertase
MEERRLLLAVALSLLVLTAYQLLFPQPPPRPRPQPSPATAAPSVPPAAAAPERAVPPPEAPASAAPAAEPPAIADADERRVEVETQDLSVAFTNRGARLLSWRLLHYHDARGRPEDMVQTVPEQARPLDIETGDPALDARLREALFVPSATRLEVTGDAALEFVFAGAGVEARKTLRFQRRGYLASVTVSVRRAGAPLPARLLWGPGLGNPTAEERDVRGYQAPHAVALSSGGVDRLPVAELEQPARIEGARWLGVEGRYFAALFVPSSPTRGEVRGVDVPSPEGAPHHETVLAVELPEAEAPTLLYVGPKDHHVLAPLGRELARVVPVGDWIGPLVVPLMGMLRWMNGHIGSYGWSIVLLTVVINLALGPLRHYSIVNGIKMAKLAPEMRVIQERYRKVPALDPRRQEMQKEIAELYARHGMSMGTQMAVGCLPMLLTMPFLFAIYRVLDVSIDLRGAAYLWIPDLSQKDPLFLTPILMGASMFVMQKLTPSGMDPAQQRIMMLMPLMLAGMFFWAPAGLNLYWLVSNLCAILQQGLTLHLQKEPARAPAKEKRRR